MASSSSGGGPRPLPRSFFNADATRVAPALLGKWIIRRGPAGLRRARIVETEAYRGAGDAAAHAAAGLTARTAVLFGPPGHAYIYLIYGLHWCLNVSTRPAGEAGGVLFRALDEEDRGGQELSGPGRLTRGLEITGALNGCDLTRAGALYLADDGWRPESIAVTRRVGIRKAMELPYRYFIEGRASVSRPWGPVLARLRGMPGAVSGASPIAPGAERRLYSGIPAKAGRHRSAVR